MSAHSPSDLQRIYEARFQRNLTYLRLRWIRRFSGKQFLIVAEW